MKVFSRLAILFYVISIIILCGCVILFVSHVFLFEEVNYYLRLLYFDAQLRSSAVIMAAAWILLSMLFAKIVVGKEQQQGTIAFDNPSGRVSVSLTVLEDLVRRLVAKEHEVGPRDLFAMFYEVVLGQERGPRFGTFAKLVGKEQVLMLLKKATNS